MIVVVVVVVRGVVRGGCFYIWFRYCFLMLFFDRVVFGGFEFWFLGKGLFFGERGLSFVCFCLLCVLF